MNNNTDVIMENFINELKDYREEKQRLINETAYQI